MDIPKKRVGRPSKRPDDKTLISLYKEYNSVQIAEMYGVKDSTVRSWYSHLHKEESKKPWVFRRFR